MKKIFFIVASIFLLTGQSTIALNLEEIEVPAQVKLDKLSEFIFTREGNSVFVDKILQVNFSLQSFSLPYSCLKSTDFLITLSQGRHGVIIASIKSVSNTDIEYLKIIFLDILSEDWRKKVIWHILNDIACSLLIESLIYHQKITRCSLCKKEFAQTCVNDFQSRSFHDFCYPICSHWIHYSCFEKLPMDSCHAKKCPFCGISLLQPEDKYMIKTWGRASPGIPTTNIRVF
jgi:hypothetical protein